MSTTPSTPSYLPLAQQLAALTGEDVEKTIMIALKQRLEALPRPVSSFIAQQRLEKITALMARRKAENAPLIPSPDILYDEMGLPK